MNDGALLSVRDVTLAFDGVVALDGVSFDVAAREICAVIGPNGAGKSSLVNVISGIYRTTRGRVTFERRELRSPGSLAPLGIARTFQNLALFRGMTVLENVELGNDFRRRAGVLEIALGLGRAPAEERRSREQAEEVLALLEIGQYRNDVVGRLPYGLQKRVELARALAPKPKLLLLDEPMAGMTLDDKRDMCRFIVDANESLGTTLLLVEHDLHVVMDLSDHVVVLDYGKKIADGSPEQVQTDPAVIEAYVGNFGRAAS